jgi:hypothetical protein
MAQLQELSMRISWLWIPISAVLLAACGTTEEKTVVVQPAPGSTVVVPPNGDARVVSPHN